MQLQLQQQQAIVKLIYGLALYPGNCVDRAFTTERLISGIVLH